MPLTPPPRRERDNNTALNYTGPDSVPTCNCIIIINDIGSLTGLNAPERYPIERCLYLLTANLYPRVSSRLFFPPPPPLLPSFLSCVRTCVCVLQMAVVNLFDPRKNASGRARRSSFHFVSFRSEEGLVSHGPSLRISVRILTYE